MVNYGSNVKITMKWMLSINLNFSPTHDSKNCRKMEVFMLPGVVNKENKKMNILIQKEFHSSM